ncbi:MAG: hypothetical protein ACKVP7_00160 [Hyphomicrobiaceae bacterium]
MPGTVATWAATLGGLIVATGLVVSAGQAQMRSPSISCSISDNNVVLDLYLPLAPDGSGAGAPSSLRGALEIQHYKMAKDRRRWSLDGRSPSLIWNYGDDLKLRLLLAPGDALVDLVIETRQRIGTIGHAGTFRLETGEGVKVQGRAECQVG